MKTAIYVEEGVTQLVLTPQNEWERNVIKSMANGEQSLVIKRGQFYECRGGWIREGLESESLILRLDVAATGGH